MRGIDFDEAKQLWNDSKRVTFVARVKDEERLGIIGSYQKKVWCGIFTMREDRVRIISIRRAKKMKKKSTITAKEFDARFDRGEDISAFIDEGSIQRPGLEARRVNVDFPEWIIKNLDVESRMIGVSRQSLIKLWISERLQQEKRARA